MLFRSMGLERLACVMQGVDNLFEVDTVQSVLHHVEDVYKRQTLLCQASGRAELLG